MKAYFPANALFFSMLLFPAMTLEEKCTFGVRSVALGWGNGSCEGVGVGEGTDPRPRLSLSLSFYRFENLCAILLDPEKDRAVIGFSLLPPPVPCLPISSHYFAGK